MNARANWRMPGNGGKVVLLTLAVSGWLCVSPLVARAESADAANAAPVAAEYEKLPLAQLVGKARAGDVAAQFELGARFNYGRGVPRHVSEALRWLRSAGQRGHREAQRILALKFYHGYDVAMDHPEALRWAVQLAEAGDVPGQIMLANMYANGEGGPRQLVRAYAWYAIATAGAQQALERGEMAMAKTQAAAAEQRDYVAALLLPDEEAEAQRMASEWWLRKAKVKLPPAKKAASSP